MWYTAMSVYECLWSCIICIQMLFGKGRELILNSTTFFILKSNSSDKSL